MGDSLMYSILPLEASALGITLQQVGILLSVNRFIRLLSNRWAGDAFERYGPYLPFMVTVIVGLATTFAYGWKAGFLVFLLARTGWGIAWSGLRQGGYVSTWTGNPSVRGRLTGLLLGVIRLGSAVGVVLGGFLYDRFGFSAAVYVVFCIGLLAIPIALLLPWRNDSLSKRAQTESARISSDSSDLNERPPTEDTVNNWRQFAIAAFGAPLRRWLTISVFFSYLMGGIVVSTTSLFIASRVGGGSSAIVFGIGVATLTGLLHGTRWLTNIVIGPIVGALSDFFGKSNTLLALGILSLLTLIGLSVTTVTFLAVILLLIILLLDGSITVVINATASTMATAYPRPHIFLSAFATLADVGSAFGPIIAFSVFASSRLPTIYVISGIVLLFCLSRFWLADRRPEPV